MQFFCCFSFQEGDSFSLKERRLQEKYRDSCLQPHDNFQSVNRPKNTNKPSSELAYTAKLPEYDRHFF